MGLIDLFKRKPPTNLAPGETSGDYIGCYLFGIEGEGGNEPSYHSLAVTREELAQDCRQFFQQLLAMRVEQMQRAQSLPGMPPELAGLMPLHIREQYERDIKVSKDIIENIETYIRLHLQQDTSKHFWRICDMTLFLRIGAGQRQKHGGKYIE